MFGVFRNIAFIDQNIVANFVETRALHFQI